ncbi:MAG: peroxidase family protein, partial [Vicinamibacterales bacterium]
MRVGCVSQRVGGLERPLTAADAAHLGCRPDDTIDRSLVADSSAPSTYGSERRLTRAPRTFRNTNTAWWDASQLYGFDERSRRRVKRDPTDRARLLLEANGYLPLLAPDDPMLPDWAGQEAAAFADNWNIGLSFYHNVFAREHNAFVDAFRKQQAATPDADCGLRNPANPTRVIAYRDVTPDELFEVARLVVAAEIAKIHTTEWTTQLLYDEPLFRAMNSNWHGFVSVDNAAANALATVVRTLGGSPDASRANTWYSVLASGPGIFGLGSHKRDWNIANPDDINGGINHFGSPFNFPEEFVSVYRLHPLVPDLIDYREAAAPDAIRNKIPVVASFRGRATSLMHERGLANWA